MLNLALSLRVSAAVARAPFGGFSAKRLGAVRHIRADRATVSGGSLVGPLPDEVGQHPAYALMTDDTPVAVLEANGLRVFSSTSGSPAMRYQTPLAYADLNETYACILVRSLDVSGRQAILAEQSTNTYLQVGNGEVQIRVGGNYTPVGSLTSATWTFFEMVTRATGQVFYRNGVVTYSYTTPVTFRANTLFGSDAPSTNYPFGGRVADLIVYPLSPGVPLSDAVRDQTRAYLAERQAAMTAAGL